MAAGVGHMVCPLGLGTGAVGMFHGPLLGGWSSRVPTLHGHGPGSAHISWFPLL